MSKFLSKLKDFRQWDLQTAIFYLNWAVYLAVLIITTVYCYARLDYVRSYHIDNPAAHIEK